MDDTTKKMHLDAGRAYGREATCGTKVDYKSEESADRAAQKMMERGSKQLEAYPCYWCKGWHIGRAMTEIERERFQPLIVFELRNCGNRSGLFKTEDGAMNAAQERLDEYHEMYAEMDAEELADSEPLTTKILSWNVQRLDNHGLVTPFPSLGWDALTAFYAAENGYFTIHEIEVKP